MNRRRIARVVYLALFVGLEYFTTVFTQYPTLRWLGIAGIVVVFFDAVICARRRWRVLKSELDGNESESDPTC